MYMLYNSCVLLGLTYCGGVKDSNDSLYPVCKTFLNFKDTKTLILIVLIMLIIFYMNFYNYFFDRFDVLDVKM